MLTMTAHEAKRKFGPLLQAADENPVAISKHGKRRFVVLSAALFEVMTEVWDAHRHSQALFAYDTALAKLLKGEDESGYKLLQMASSRLRNLLEGRGQQGCVVCRRMECPRPLEQATPAPISAHDDGVRSCPDK
jgi:prevent-host-death family protein